MSELGALEQAVLDLLSAISDGGGPVFRSVSGFTDPTRRQAVEYILGLLPPAAVVVYDGRTRSQLADAVIGLPKLTVLIATQNLRGGDDVRQGDGSALGGYDLLGMVTSALDGTLVETDRRLSAVDEQIVAADVTHVVYEQRYVLDRVSTLSPPYWREEALAGTDSLVNVLVAGVPTETVAFAFPGIDGEFRHFLGRRSRPIQWVGQLRAADDQALNTLEAGTDDAVADPQAYAMVDSWSRVYVDCLCERFVRLGPRRRHPVTGYALQNFELHFTQLNP